MRGRGGEGGLAHPLPLNQPIKLVALPLHSTRLIEGLIIEGLMMGLIKGPTRLLAHITCRGPNSHATCTGLERSGGLERRGGSGGQLRRRDA